MKETNNMKQTKKQMLKHQLAQLFPKNMETTKFSEQEEIMIDIIFQLEQLRKTQIEIKAIILNQISNGPNN